MTLQHILDKNLIYVNLPAKTKQEVLHTLANGLQQNNYIDSVEEFLADVYRWEQQTVTGVGNFVAIPHGKSWTVQKVGAAIAILKDTVEWESLDDKGVKIVVLFAIGNQQEGFKAHLRLLAAFARKLVDDAVVNDLLNVTSVDEVLTILNQ